ncbi:Heparanase [Escovopsis weberi]|uniref:Heparanase n=1 Tax=Escovopsis weberi TaxID=150374 RepID=A0A0M8MTJ5_ESCWE|nr:Heparanase [Escovopsis weberi]
MSNKHLAPLSLLLTQALAAGPMMPSFVGLSIEALSFPAFAGKSPICTKDSPNVFSYNLVDALAKAQNSSMLVRVGGNTGDRAIFDSSLTTPTAGACPKADPGAYQCIGPSYFESYGAFPAGTLYSHQFNLGAFNSSGLSTLQATVPLACNALRGQLNIWEMGNEPDLYTNVRRPANYSAQDYSDEWLSRTATFVDLLQSNCPDMAQNIHYMGPSVSSPGSRLHLIDILTDEGAGNANITQYSVHNYMSGATSPGTTLQGTLMSHSKVKGSIGGHLNYAATVKNLNGRYIIGEQNSLYGGGAFGMSDTFGAGLWALDFSLYAASTGVIHQIYFHQSAGAAYAAWAATGDLATHPPYYGQLAANTFLRNSDTLDIRELVLTSDTNMDSAYGGFVDGKMDRAAIINFRQFNSTSAQSSRPSQTYTVPVDAGSSWTVKRLTAAGATDTTGVTFNGFAYDAATLGVPALVAGRESNAVVKADSNGNLKVTVANTEAIILERHD